MNVSLVWVIFGQLFPGVSTSISRYCFMLWSPIFIFTSRQVMSLIFFLFYNWESLIFFLTQSGKATRVWALRLAVWVWMPAPSFVHILTLDSYWTLFRLFPHPKNEPHNKLVWQGYHYRFSEITSIHTARQ